MRAEAGELRCFWVGRKRTQRTQRGRGQATFSFVLCAFFRGHLRPKTAASRATPRPRGPCSGTMQMDQGGPANLAVLGGNLPARFGTRIHPPETASPAHPTRRAGGPFSSAFDRMVPAHTGRYLISEDDCHERDQKGDRETDDRNRLRALGASGRRGRHRWVRSEVARSCTIPGARTFQSCARPTARDAKEVFPPPRQLAGPTTTGARL